jgi:tetratricopeptide (TPR) repeat protein
MTLAMSPVKRIIAEIILVLCWGSANAQQSAIDFYNTAQVKQKAGGYKEAVDLYAKAIELDPQYVDAYGNLGYCLLETRAFDSAEENFNKCLQLDNTYWRAAIGLSILYFQEGDFPSSRWYFTMASTLEPRLKEGMAGVEKLEGEGIMLSQSDKQALKALYRKRGGH